MNDTIITIDRMDTAPSSMEEEMAAQMLDDARASDVAALFKALSDPTRVRIIVLLSRFELCVSDVARLMGMSQPAISHQLRLLRQLKIVRGRREGKCVFYQLDDEHVHQLLQQGLAHAQHE